jgi:hypothetical protein
MLKWLLKMTERQGLLKGDLNFVQRIGLQWLMELDIKERDDIERLRIETTALASNPATSGEFLKYLFEQREQEEQEEIEWVTPHTPQEMEMLLADLGFSSASASPSQWVQSPELEALASADGQSEAPPASPEER